MKRRLTKRQMDELRQRSLEAFRVLRGSLSGHGRMINPDVARAIRIVDSIEEQLYDAEQALEKDAK